MFQNLDQDEASRLGPTQHQTRGSRTRLQEFGMLYNITNHHQIVIQIDEQETYQTFPAALQIQRYTSQ